MRRLLVAGLVIALVSAAGLAALLYAADADFVAGALSRLIGRRVDVGSINLRLGPRLEVELTQVRVEDPAGPDAPPLLEIEHALGKQAWPRLLAGQLVPLDWELVHPVLRLHAAATATGEPFDFGSIPRLGLSLSDGEVHYEPASGPAWLVRGLRLEAKRAVLGTRVEGEASGRISRGERAVTELALRFTAQSHELSARGTVADLDLAALPQGAVSAKGRANGRFQVGFGYDERDVDADLDLDVAKLSLVIPRLSEPLAPARARLAGRATWKRGALALALRELALDDLVAEGDFRLDTGTPGRVTLDVRFAPFEPGRLDRLNPVTVLGARFDTWRRVAERIQAGVIENARVRIDVPRVGGEDAISFDTPVAPEAFRVELSARDGIYRPSPETLLEHMSGALLIDGNRLEIEKLHLAANGDELPEMHIRIDGMHRLVNLPKDEDEVHGGPGADLAGFAAVRAALAPDDPNVPPPPPPEILFTDLAVRYPSFVLPLREASGRLRFPDGGLTAEGVRGVLGGAPATLEVRYERALDTLAIDVRYLDGIAPGVARTGPRWLEGKIALPKLDIADLPLENVRASIAAEGTELTFSDILADLSGGSGVGEGQVALGSAESAPFRFSFNVKGFDMAPHVGHYGLPDRSVTGIGHVKGTVSGAMRAGGNFGREGALDMKVALKDGAIADLPGLVAIARLPSLSGVSGLLGKPLPYSSLIVDLKLEHGRLTITKGKLLGPELRMLAEGEGNLNVEPMEINVVVALLFLRTLDNVLGSLPIVRNVMLGKNQNLLALYVRVEGPQDDLRVTPLPPETVRNVVGFASESVMKGVRALGRLIPIGRGESSNAPESPPPTTP